jgi:AraC-like DNA-binding protein
MESLLRGLLTSADRLLEAEAPGRSPASVVLGLLRRELAQVGPASPLVPPLSESLRLYLVRAGEGEGHGADSVDPTAVRLADVEMGDARVWRAIALMQEELAKRWRVEDLAKAVGMSRPVFAREFVAATGVTPLRYLTSCRLVVAADLLRESKATLAEIGAEVGYESEYAFNRAFKRHHAVSPGIYRRRLQTTAAVALRSAA